METLRKRRWLRFSLRQLFLLVTLIGVGCGYVGSYYTLIIRREFHADPIVIHDADYRLGGVIAHVVFAPMHFVDVRLRREYWHPRFMSEDELPPRDKRRFSWTPP
jgi:hypothetical protein